MVITFSTSHLVIYLEINDNFSIPPSVLYNERVNYFSSLFSTNFDQDKLTPFLVL